ncbi:MAG: hypothetical protein ACE15D_14340 [Candidatus Eisenbacteria bacterium]|nr:hypothetical protein [Candidatus Eisenbacteria bacterium]
MRTERKSKLLAPYIGLTVATAAGILILFWIHASPKVPMSGVAFWFLLSLAAETFWLPTPTGKGMVSMSLAANLAVLLALPATLAMSLAGLSVVLADLLLHRRSAIKSVFNGSQTIVALALALSVARWLGLGSVGSIGMILLLHPVAVVSLLPIFSLTNTLLVSGAIALSSGEPFWKVWRENYGDWYQHFSSLALMVVGIGLLIGLETIGYMSGLAMLLVLLVLRDAYRLRVGRGVSFAAAWKRPVAPTPLDSGSRGGTRGVFPASGCGGR